MLGLGPVMVMEALGRPLEDFALRPFPSECSR
jgi:hypothetical protein